MNRLTYKSLMSDYGIAKTFESEFAEKCALRNALGKYEDLGCSPDELRKIISAFSFNQSGNISKES